MITRVRDHLDDRHVLDAAAADLAELVHRVAGGGAAGQVLHQAPEGQEHAERDDEARHLEQRRADAVEEADERPDTDHQDHDGEDAALVLADEVAGHHHLGGDHGAHRQVELARDDDVVLPDRGDRQRRRAADEADQEARVPEVRVGPDHGDQQHARRARRPRRPGVIAARSVRWARVPCLGRDGAAGRPSVVRHASSFRTEPRAEAWPNLAGRRTMLRRA